VVGLAPRLVALGGGGYDIRNVARAWTVAWAIMNDVELAPEIPAAYDADLARFRFASRDLWDPPEALPAHLERPVRTYVDQQVEAVRRLIFPKHGL
jgi:acetoin utilization protein AcuC